MNPENDDPAKKAIWQRELREMLNPTYYEQQKRVNPKYIYYDKAAKYYEKSDYRELDTTSEKITEMFATLSEKKDACDWNIITAKIFKSEMDKFLLPYMLKNEKYGIAFQYGPALKTGLDVIAVMTISRSIRRAYFVYEYGFIYSMLVAAAYLQIGHNLRKRDVSLPILYGQESCDFCAYARGFSWDLIMTVIIPFGSIMVNTLMQAERFKSAQVPSYSRWKFTKSQTSLFKGIFRETARRGGGLRGATALAIVPGLLMTNFQLSNSKEIWESIPEEAKEKMMLRQRASLLSVIHR